MLDLPSIYANSQPSDIDNIIRQLENATIWVEGVDRPLKHGDTFTLTGDLAIRAKSLYSDIFPNLITIDTDMDDTEDPDPGHGSGEAGVLADVTPVSYYDFDSFTNDPVVIDTGTSGNNTSAAQSEHCQRIPSFSGQGAEFDPAHYLFTQSTNCAVAHNVWTIDGWIYGSPFQAREESSGFWSNVVVSLLGNNNGTLGLAFINNDADHVNTSNTLTADIWNYFCFTYDPAIHKAKIKINNNEFEEFNMNPIQNDDDEIHYIGYDANGLLDSPNMTGKLDEIGIYHIVLSEEQANVRYEGKVWRDDSWTDAVAPTYLVSNPIFYYKFNESTQTDDAIDEMIGSFSTNLVSQDSDPSANGTYRGFDGTNYFVENASSFYSLNEPFSISFLYEPKNASYATNKGIVGRYGDEGIWLIWQGTDQKLRMSQMDLNRYLVATATWDTPLVNDQFYRIVAGYRVSDNKIWLSVNGGSAVEATTTDFGPDSGQKFQISIEVDGGFDDDVLDVSYFEGFIDEMAYYYHIELTRDEILTLNTDDNWLTYSTTNGWEPYTIS
jgi:hypothetical protein